VYLKFYTFRAPIGLVAIPDAREFEDAVFVVSLLDAQELAMPVSIGGTEIGAPMETGQGNWLSFNCENGMRPTG
jgi:hypothetical protein